jgi:hypothetical protein
VDSEFILVTIMAKQSNGQSLLHKIDFDSMKELDDISIGLTKKSWKKFEDNLFKKAGL